MFIAPPQSMVVEKRSPLEEDKSRASNQNLRREQNLPAFTTQPNLHASYKIIYHICVLNNRHLFPFWMVRTWLASKPAAAVTIANRKQIWYLSKNWHNQTLKAIVLQSYNCNFVHSENFSQNEIVWMRVIKKCNIYVKFNSQSVSKKITRCHVWRLSNFDCRFIFILILIVLWKNLRCTWQQIQNFVPGTNINSDRKVKIPLTWRKFPAITKMKMDSVNKVNVLYPLPWLEATLLWNKKKRFIHKVVIFVKQRFIHESEIDDIRWQNPFIVLDSTKQSWCVWCTC